MRLLVDSAFVIDYLADEAGAVERWATVYRRGDEPLVNEIVICEVRAGLRPRDLAALRTFLAPVEFIQPGPEQAMAAGQWRAEAHAIGRRLSLADSLIAAAAEFADAAVLTRNLRDFAMTPVRIETY